MTLLERYINVRKKLFDKYYSRLNDKQKEAVYAADGPLLVLAGAGSGKTTVLVQRIAHLIKYGRCMDEKNIPENNLLEPYIAMLEKVADEENPSGFTAEQKDGFYNTFVDAIKNSAE